MKILVFILGLLLIVTNCDEDKPSASGACIIIEDPDNEADDGYCKAEWKEGECKEAYEANICLDDDGCTVSFKENEQCKDVGFAYPWCGNENGQTFYADEERANFGCEDDF